MSDHIVVEYFSECDDYEDENGDPEIVKIQTDTFKDIDESHFIYNHIKHYVDMLGLPICQSLSPLSILNK